MNRTSHLSLLSLTAVLVSGLGAQIQSTLSTTHLPTYAVPQAVTTFGRGDLLQTLRTALNSVDDSVRVRIEAGASVAIIPTLNAGGTQAFDVVVTRTANGVEAVVSAENAANAGVEAYEGLEIQVGRADAKRVVFAWPSIDAAAKGVENLALGHFAGFRKIPGLVQANVQLAQQAAIALGDAILDLEATKRVEAAALATFRQIQSDLSSAESRLAAAARKLASARDDLNAVRRKADKLPKAVRWTMNAAIKAAEGVLRRAQSALNGITKTTNLLRTALNIARTRLEQARAEVARRQATVDSKRDLLAAAQRTARQWEELGEALTRPMLDLLSRVVAVEFELRTGAALSAFLSPIPGASIANLGMGASAATFVGAAVRYDLPRNGERRLSIRSFRTLALEVAGGFVAGIQAEAGSALEVAATFVKRGSSAFRFEGVATELRLDLDLWAVVGAGHAVRHGAGRQVKVAISGTDWLNAVSACGQLAQNPTPATLANALRQVQADVSVQDRWNAGLVTRVGFSAAGNGATISGQATWRDAGTNVAQRLSAGDVIGVLLQPQTARESIALLAPHARR